MVKRCCWTCKNRTTGRGYDFDVSDIICRIKYDESEETYLLGIPLKIIEEKRLLFNAEDMTREEIKQKLMEMGKDCKYWKPKR